MWRPNRVQVRSHLAALRCCGIILFWSGVVMRYKHDHKHETTEESECRRWLWPRLFLPNRRSINGLIKNKLRRWQHTFFSFHNASRPTPETFTTLKRTPGISPLALPRRPKPEIRTSSFSSTKFKQPSFCNRDKGMWATNPKLQENKNARARKLWPFSRSWWAVHGHTSGWQSLAALPRHQLSQGRFPLHGKSLQWARFWRCYRGHVSCTLCPPVMMIIKGKG